MFLEYKGSNNYETDIMAKICWSCEQICLFACSGCSGCMGCYDACTAKCGGANKS